MAFDHRPRPFPFIFMAFNSVMDKKPVGCVLCPWCTRQRFQLTKRYPVTILLIIQASIYIYMYILVLHLNYDTHIWLLSYNASSSGTIRDILILCNKSFSKRICMEIESFRWELIHSDAMEMRSSLKLLEICSQCIYVEKENGILVSQKYNRQSFLPNGVNPELLTFTLSANRMLKDSSPIHK